MIASFFLAGHTFFFLYQYDYHPFGRGGMFDIDKSCRLEQNRLWGLFNINVKANNHDQTKFNNQEQDV